MSLIDKNSLASFFGSNSNAFEPDDEGIKSAIDQATNIVFQSTLIPIPEDISNAIPQLQFYAHCIFAWINIGIGKTDDATKDHRKTMFESTMKELDEIRQNKRNIFDSLGNIISRPAATSGVVNFYCNNERSERL